MASPTAAFYASCFRGNLSDTGSPHDEEGGQDLLHLPAERGAARPANWDFDRSLLRSCLLHLRQICTHIQVGQMQLGTGRGDLRLHLGRQLMTMTEALEKMRSDHSQETMIESRLQVRTSCVIPLPILLVIGSVVR